LLAGVLFWMSSFAMSWLMGMHDLAELLRVVPFRLVNPNVYALAALPAFACGLYVGIKLARERSIHRASYYLLAVVPVALPCWFAAGVLISKYGAANGGLIAIIAIVALRGPLIALLVAAILRKAINWLTRPAFLPLSPEPKSC
jgi:hypothetical protein